MNNECQFNDHFDTAMSLNVRNDIVAILRMNDPTLELQLINMELQFLMYQLPKVFQSRVRTKKTD
jgi:hypothetical protein